LIILLNTRLVFAATLIPGGESIGIIVNYDGIVISGCYDFEYDGKLINPSDNDIKVGDIITAINQEKVSSSEELIEQISSSLKDSQNVTLTISRNQKVITRDIQVYYDASSNSFKTGLYIRDSLSGIGTVTFYDPSTLTYGALGHKMSDSDLESDVVIDAGQVFESFVVNVTRSYDNQPGEKIATIEKSHQLGIVNINSDFGVYGEYSNIFKSNTSTIEYRNNRVKTTESTRNKGNSI